MSITKDLLGKKIKFNSPGMVDIKIHSAELAQNVAAVIINGNYVLSFSKAAEIAKEKTDE